MGIFDVLKKAADRATDLAKLYAPSALSPEKRFAKAIVMGCAMVTMADGQVEESEINTCDTFIRNIPEIKQYLGETQAQELLMHVINELNAQFKMGVAMFDLMVNRYVSEMREGVTNPQWQDTVILTAQTVAGSGTSTGAKEQQIINKIKQAFGKP
jgi:tellurite resistance protein